jgi:hypothetical protein
MFSKFRGKLAPMLRCRRQRHRGGMESFGPGDARRGNAQRCDLAVRRQEHTCGIADAWRSGGVMTGLRSLAAIPDMSTAAEATTEREAA